MWAYLTYFGFDGPSLGLADSTDVTAVTLSCLRLPPFAMLVLFSRAFLMMAYLYNFLRNDVSTKQMVVLLWNEKSLDDGLMYVAVKRRLRGQRMRRDVFFFLRLRSCLPFTCSPHLRPREMPTASAFDARDLPTLSGVEHG